MNALASAAGALGRSPLAAPTAAALNWAQAWIENQQQPAKPAHLPHWPWAEVAWALKIECDRAWTQNPPRTALCAAALARLAEQADDPVPAALAPWTAGVAALAQGQPQRALEHLHRAESALRALGLAFHAHQTQVPQMVGQAMLGQHEQALACGQAALRAFDAAGDEQAAGKVELNLGSMLLRQDRYGDAATCYRRAALRFARVGDHAHSVMADIGLATVRTAQYEFDEALHMAERARQRAQAHGLAPLMAVIHDSLGRLELSRGRLGAAMHWLAQALHAYERQGPPPALAEARRALADAYLAANLLPEAVALYDQAIASANASQAPVEEAWARVQRARAQIRLQQPDFALQGLATARLLFETQRNRVGVAVVDLHEAAAALQSGDAAAALGHAQRAQAGLEGDGVSGLALEAAVLGAQALERLGRSEEAAASFNRTLLAARELPQVQALCAQGLGRHALAQGQLEQAGRHFESAAASFEAQRDTLVGDELRVAFADRLQQTHDALVQLALRRRDAAAAAGPAAVAASDWALLAAIERGRARALQAGLQGAAPAAGEAADEPRLAALRVRVNWLQAQWQQALAQNAAERAAHWQHERLAAERELLEGHRQRQLAAVLQTAGQRQGALLQELPGELAANEAIVVWHQQGDELLACVLRREGLRVLCWSAPGLDARIDKLRIQVTTQRFRAQGLQVHAATLFDRTRQHLHALYQALWSRLEPLLADVEQVCVVPHRKLHYVPFAALHDGRQWLAERMVLAHAPSIAAWRSLARWQPPPSVRVLAAGVGGESLPHVAAELESVRRAYGQDVLVLGDAAATVDAVKQAAAGADIVHLACHGEFRADSPAFSQLALSDSALTLLEASRLPLQGSLVTLSACETGVSLVSAGDEVIGLVRGFLMAGAASVVSTLWTVDDDTTALLMAQFYRHLRSGRGPAAALALAQRHVLQRHPHPYHWAPFTLHGRS